MVTGIVTPILFQGGDVLAGSPAVEARSFLNESTTSIIENNIIIIGLHRLIQRDGTADAGISTSNNP
jgi:hypothetical protein